MKISLFAIVITSVFIISGCGSNVETTANVKIRNSTNSASNAASDPGYTYTLEPLPANANTNKSPAGNYGSNAKQRPIVDEPGSKPEQKPASVVAPENSTVTVSTNDAGAFVETRVFNGDPSIEKVEKITNGKDRTAKIYLKSGKVVSFDPVQAPLINAVPLSKLRELAGISGPAKTDGTESRGAKPKQ